MLALAVWQFRRSVCAVVEVLGSTRYRLEDWDEDGRATARARDRSRATSLEPSASLFCRRSGCGDKVAAHGQRGAGR